MSELPEAGRFDVILVSHFNSLILICKIVNKQKQVLDEQAGLLGNICHCTHQARVHHLDKIHQTSLPVLPAVSRGEMSKANGSKCSFIDRSLNHNMIKLGANTL